MLKCRSGQYDRIVDTESGGSLRHTKEFFMRVLERDERNGDAMRALPLRRREDVRPFRDSITA